MDAVTTGFDGSHETLAAEVLLALAAIEHAAAQRPGSAANRRGAEPPTALAGLSVCLLATEVVMTAGTVVHLLYDAPPVASSDPSPLTAGAR